MLGRLNAANNQTANLDRQIEDVLEHFVYLPKQAPANPQDIPFFLSTRLEAPDTTSQETMVGIRGDPVQVLNQFESAAAKLATNYEVNMVRF